MVFNSTSAFATKGPLLGNSSNFDTKAVYDPTCRIISQYALSRLAAHRPNNTTDALPESLPGLWIFLV